MTLPTLAIPSTDLRVSAFCYGTSSWGERPEEEIARLYDQFREAGGNFFDSAHIYAFWANALGEPERVLGRRMRNERRSDIVVGTKGGHPALPGYDRPANATWPEVIRTDIRDSLDRLKLDYIDLYYLHRDNLSVPVGEIIDCLAAEVDAGRIRYFAGSNWSRQRFTAANAYAKKNGKPGFVASQPLWNLAGFTAPVNWDPTHQVLNDDSAEIAWYAENQFPAIPFTPTANGVFAPGTKIRSQYNAPTTHRRIATTIAIAMELSATPTQIALAWLRQHPFPVIPILGTLNAVHLADALASVNMNLTADQLARLV